MLKPSWRLRHSSLWLAFFCLQNLIKTPCPSSFTPVRDTFSLRYNQNHCKQLLPDNVVLKQILRCPCMSWQVLNIPWEFAQKPILCLPTYSQQVKLVNHVTLILFILTLPDLYIFEKHVLKVSIHTDLTIYHRVLTLCIMCFDAM